MGDDGEIGDFDTGEGGGEVTKLKLSLRHGRRCAAVAAHFYPKISRTKEEIGCHFSPPSFASFSLVISYDVPLAVFNTNTISEVV